MTILVWAKTGSMEFPTSRLHPGGAASGRWDLSPATGPRALPDRGPSRLRRKACLITPANQKTSMGASPTASTTSHDSAHRRRSIALGFLPRDGAILRLPWLTACEQPVTNASGNGINGARKSHHLRHLAIGKRMRRRLTARLSPLFKARQSAARTGR